jgi:hypothetical protein
VSKRSLVKAFIIIFLSCIIFLTGCSSSSREVEVYFNRETYLLTGYKKGDTTRVYMADDKSTILVKLQGDSYIVKDGDKEYIVMGDRDSLTVEYPNGEKSWVRSMGDAGFGGGGYVEGYPSAYDFRDLVFHGQKKGEFNGGQFVAAILLLIGSIISVASPETTWFLKRGWKYRDAEPSDTYISLTRVGGVIGCIIAVIFMFASCAG